MRKWFLILFLFLLSFPLRAENQASFKDLTFSVENSLSSAIDLSFDKTKARLIFRVLFPYPPDKVWPVLIDTNSWTKVHASDYKDSRTLDQNQFDLVVEKQPTSIKAFYELIGEQSFPSQYGRKQGQVWTSYILQRFNLPWPLKDRWVVMKIKNDETKSAQGKYRYEYKMSAGNFRELGGYWELLPAEGKPGWTEFRGEYSTDPGVSVPHFLAKNIYPSSIRRSAKENWDVMKKNN